MIFDLGLWPLTTRTYEGFHILSINQVWFKSDFQLFKWGHFHIFSLFYNVTSDDLWPWYIYMTLDLISKWGFPCCIYDPTLIEIHHNMWKINQMLTLFSQQTRDNNNRQQGTKWSLCVFPAKASNTKSKCEAEHSTSTAVTLHVIIRG